MRSEEIERIEKELGINLPPHYTTFLSTFEGLNSFEVDISHLLYSNADAVIQINKMLGFHLTGKIISNKLIIGDSGGGDFYLIDLVDKTNEAVYVFDHEETVENCFDKRTGTFHWHRLDKYDTVESYRISILQMFE